MRLDTDRSPSPSQTEDAEIHFRSRKIFDSDLGAGDRRLRVKMHLNNSNDSVKRRRICDDDDDEEPLPKLDSKVIDRRQSGDGAEYVDYSIRAS